ncbi:hypothetical protein CAOG_08179 [Capsaspora owczarzaki ATCC 30864]|nr:hypothetical protein CAOG_08179 [Capsaspora owczarzaki ATCC 30864]|eukprot:XP_004342780.1 hypothetical protein CAOG_08179 [Capsaspora owczarzaki ATCC 30864]
MSTGAAAGESSVADKYRLKIEQRKRELAAQQQQQQANGQQASAQPTAADAQSQQQLAWEKAEAEIVRFFERTQPGYEAAYKEIQAKEAEFARAEAARQAANDLVAPTAAAATSTSAPTPTPSATPSAKALSPEAQAEAIKKAPFLPSYMQPLSSLIPADVIANGSRSDIIAAWNAAHLGKPDHFASVMPAEAYRRLTSRSRRNSRFVLPVPRGEGFEWMVAEFTNASLLFTSLLDYQTHQEHASSLLSVTFFTDGVLEKHGIALQRAYADHKKLPRELAESLLRNIAHVYLAPGSTGAVSNIALARRGQGAEGLYGFVETFNQQPKQFDFNILLDELKARGLLQL